MVSPLLTKRGLLNCYDPPFDEKLQHAHISRNRVPLFWWRNLVEPQSHSFDNHLLFNTPANVIVVSREYYEKVRGGRYLDWRAADHDLNPTLSEKDVKDILDALDLRENGTVEWYEFERLFDMEDIVEW